MIVTGRIGRQGEWEGKRKMRRLLTLLTVVAAVSAAMAAPASAEAHQGHRSFGGEQVMVLNEKPEGGLGLYGCEEISWFGTIELHGRTFGMALYPIDGYDGDDGLYHYEEGWKVFTGKFKVKDGELKRCTPGRVIASGVDEGVWALDTGAFESFGTVEYATPPLRSWQGQAVHQSGVTEPIFVKGLGEVFGFYGSLELI